MSTIWLFYGETSYEYPCAPISAHTTIEAAEACVKACVEYERKKPRTDSSMSDAVFYRQWKKYERWRANHPAGEMNSSWEHFDVMELELKDPQP